MPNELERTPGAVAVSQRPCGGGDSSALTNSVAASSITQKHGVCTPNSRVQGTASPDYLDYIAKSGVSLPPHTPFNPLLKDYSTQINLFDNSYLLPLCPAWVTLAECNQGHQFAKELLCGKEWCCTCGQDWSSSHQRRFARWLPKAKQLSQAGYLVITFPVKYRYRLRSKDALSNFRNKIIHYLKSHGISRGLVRWHFFGGNSISFHPHLNLILDSGRLSKRFLTTLRLYLQSVLDISNIVFHYSFVTEIPKIIHILKYVTRSTFKVKSWDEFFADELYNFRNQTSFGSWKDPEIWPKSIDLSKFDHIISIQNKECPLCRDSGIKSLITWRKKPLPYIFLLALIQSGATQPIGAGYHIIHYGTRSPPLEKKLELSIF